MKNKEFTVWVVHSTNKKECVCSNPILKQLPSFCRDPRR